MPFREVSRSHPCPVCAHTGWCRVTEDGELILCRRADAHPTLGAGQKLLDRNQDPYYRFFTRDRAPNDPPRYSHALGADHPADPEERHQVYAALLRALPARPEVDREFDRRKVPADSPLRKKCKWLPGPGRAAIARQLVRAGLESLMARTPGFYVREGPDRDGKPQRWWSIAGAEGLVIPAYNADGYIVGLLIRPKEPTGPKYVWLTSGKRGGAKQSPPPIHVPHKFTGDTATVRITEGALKAWVATSLGDRLTIGLPGVYGGPRLLKTLRRLGASTVRIAFDADMLRNRHVALATSRLYQLLTRRTRNRPLGFAVELERWAEADGKGIDDLLSAGKHPDVLQGEAVGRFIAQMVDQSASPGLDDPGPPGEPPAGPDSRPSPERGGRIVMDANNNDYKTVVRSVIAVLAGKDEEVFQKDGGLVEVVHPPAVEGREPPHPHIADLSSSNLTVRIAGLINFMHVPAPGKGEPYPVDPPKWIGTAVHDHNKWPGIRPLVGVSLSPVMRPDGSVHQTPGYDERTGVLYLPLAPFDPIPAHPTLADARAAVATLWDGVRQFHWTERADFAVWLCEVLTMAVRYAIPGPVPMFVHTANIFSSGKTLLTAAAAVIGTGRPPPKSTWPTNHKKEDDAEELRKTVVSVAIAGHPAYLFDNIPTGHGFGNHVLDNALTAENESGRALGTNDTPPRPAVTVYLGTGNNIRPVGDTVRRCLIARLHNPSAQPDQARHDGPEVDVWARENRGRLFTAALTLVSAYIRAGRPDQHLPPMGTFVGWSNLIRSAVVWAGEPDPNETRREFEEENPEQQVVGQLITLLRLASPKNEAVTAGEIVKEVRKQTHEEESETSRTHAVRTFPLLEAYRDIFGGKRPDATQLGKKFADFKGRPHISGQSVERTDHLDRNGVARWYVKGLVRGCAGVTEPPPPHSPPHTNTSSGNHNGPSAGVAGVTSTPADTRGSRDDRLGYANDAHAHMVMTGQITPATPASADNLEWQQDLTCGGDRGGGAGSTPAHPSTPPIERGFL